MKFKPNQQTIDYIKTLSTDLSTAVETIKLETKRNMSLIDDYSGVIDPYEEKVKEALEYINNFIGQATAPVGAVLEKLVEYSEDIAEELEEVEKGKTR